MSTKCKASCRACAGKRSGSGTSNKGASGTISAHFGPLTAAPESGCNTVENGKEGPWGEAGQGRGGYAIAQERAGDSRSPVAAARHLPQQAAQGPCEDLLVASRTWLLEPCPLQQPGNIPHPSLEIGLMMNSSSVAGICNCCVTRMQHPR
jgi:hypothetical protein